MNESNDKAPEQLDADRRLAARTPEQQARKRNADKRVWSRLSFATGEIKGSLGQNLTVGRVSPAERASRDLTDPEIFGRIGRKIKVTSV